MSLVQASLSMNTQLHGMNPCALNHYNYNDSAIKWLGRWNDTGSGKWTAWSGGNIVFKTNGTNYVIVHTDIVDPNNTALCFLTSAVDNQEDSQTVWYLSTIPQLFTGTMDKIIMLPNTGEHTVRICTGGLRADIFAQVSKTTITGFSVAPAGSISTWTQGTNQIQCVGDSWLATQFCWHRFMNPGRWELYPVSNGGMACEDMDAWYTLDYTGQTNASDPSLSYVMVSFGVNDYNRSISGASFEASMDSLFDKIRIKQPTAKIILVQVPDNVGAGKTYGQYGANMQNVVNSKTNAQYISTTSIQGSLTWYDANHLDGAGLVDLAEYVDSQIP